MGTEIPVVRFVQCGLNNSVDARPEESAPAARKLLTRRHNRWMHHDKKTCKCAVCKQIRGELVSTWYKHDKLSCKCAVCRQTRGETVAIRKQNEAFERVATGVGRNSPLRTSSRLGRPLVPSHCVREFSLGADHPKPLPAHVLQAFPMRADALRQPIWDFEFTGRVRTSPGQACWKGIVADDLLDSVCNGLVLPSRPTRARSLDRESTTANDNKNHLTTDLSIQQPIAADSRHRDEGARDEEITQPRYEKRSNTHEELCRSPPSCDTFKNTEPDHFTSCNEERGLASVRLSLATNDVLEEAVTTFRKAVRASHEKRSSPSSPVRASLQRLRHADNTFVAHDSVASEGHDGEGGNGGESRLQLPPQQSRKLCTCKCNSRHLLNHSTTLADKTKNSNWCAAYAVPPSQNFLCSMRARKRKAEIAVQRRAERQMVRKDRSMHNFRSKDACGCVNCMIQMRRRREEDKWDASCKLNKQMPLCRCLSVCGQVAARGESRVSFFPTADEVSSKANVDAQYLGLQLLPRKGVPETSSKVYAELESSGRSPSAEHKSSNDGLESATLKFSENRKGRRDNREHVSDNVGWFAHDKAKCNCLLCTKSRKCELEQVKLSEINTRENTLPQSKPKLPTSLQSDQDKNGIQGHRKNGDDGEADGSSSANG